MSSPPDAYLARLAAIHGELGLPADYTTHRGLPVQPEADPAALVVIGRNDAGRDIALTLAAAAAWRQLHAAAARDSITLIPLSGFRSVARQAEIIRAKLAAGQSLSDILRLVAAPGYSEHHTGGALDIGSPENTALDEAFAATPAYHWLVAHASAFGFHLSYPAGNPHGIAYEPWHWCWRKSR